MESAPPVIPANVGIHLKLLWIPDQVRNDDGDSSENLTKISENMLEIHGVFCNVNSSFDLKCIYIVIQGKAPVIQKIGCNTPHIYTISAA